MRALVILLVLGVATHARADERGDARAHYQTAAKLYQGGDYRAAIREFSAAQQLVPADLNNYNLALCYDKLGDGEPAIQYYRAFLDKQPGTDKRAEIEASIARLDAALKSAASKKAAPAPLPSVTAPAAPAPRSEGPVLGPAAPGPDVAPPATGPAVGSSAGPMVGPAAPPADTSRRHGQAIQATGDAQLDRVSGMNIDDIRDQRAGAHPETAPPIGAQPGQGPVAGNQPPNLAPTSVPPPAPGEEPKKEGAIYKKWWFWAVVAVGGYVVYELATTDSSSSSSGIRPAATGRGKTAGLTLLSW
ncbi:MAG TPA: hypothetical protein VGC42_07685 [Kofleriaceae bacterium]